MAILKMVDPRQFGVVPKSSTSYALISMIHHLTSATDGNGSLARFFFPDYCKAFDLIDHYLLVNKLCSLDIPPWVVRWVSDFLTARQQRVKLGTNDYSEWSEVPTGVPQGRILGPWLYALMMNDLDVSGVSLWKYVVALTVSEIVPKNMTSNIQSIVDDIQSQSESLKFTLNEDKCQEMRIQFSKAQSQCLPLTTDLL